MLNLGIEPHTNSLCDCASAQILRENESYFCEKQAWISDMLETQKHKTS